MKMREVATRLNDKIMTTSLY